jgi:hypothetical protein
MVCKRMPEVIFRGQRSWQLDRMTVKIVDTFHKSMQGLTKLAIVGHGVGNECHVEWVRKLSSLRRLTIAVANDVSKTAFESILVSIGHQLTHLSYVPL